MADMPVYYDNTDQAIPVDVEFTAANGAGTDPTAVVFTLTDPTGTVTTYTYSPDGSDPNEVISDGDGDFHIWLTPFSWEAPGVAGLWAYTWTGAGGAVANGVQVKAGTFRVYPLATVGSGMNRWYCSMEELKSRLSINPSTPSYTDNDYEMQLTIQTVTDWITTYCGRPFYQVTEVRTFRPDNVWDLIIDDIVSASSVDLDYDGDGIYEVHWTENVDYQLLRYQSRYNARNIGVAKPYNQLQVIMSGPQNPVGGQWLPWLWPFTRQDRVQVTGTWGWEAVPPSVTMAALYLASEMYKAKDAPFGVAGVSDLGLVKIQASPWVVELLRPYKNGFNVGV